MLSLIAVLVMMGSSNALADVLSDFEKYSREKGCDSIPYSDKRKECVSIQDQINRCKSDLSCKSDEQAKSKLVSDLAKLKSNIDAEKKKLEKLQSDLSREKSTSKKVAIDSDIKEVLKKITDLEADQKNSTTVWPSMIVTRGLIIKLIIQNDVTTFVQG